jgi:glycosyltransferase involved in cell wall biosynthesis
MPPVQVLLATYNGERFLRQQIDSILGQSYQPLTILARDDGSRDGTVSILQEYAQRMPDRFTLLPRDAPTGNAKWNFLRLMEESAAQYVACADQDDLWLPDKISRSMEAMQRLEQEHGETGPLLVFTDLRVVNDRLEPIHPSLWGHMDVDPASIRKLSNLLTQNVVTGCTMLLNRPLTELATRMGGGAFMHDWWIALLTCAFGNAAYLSEPSVLYRQHQGNVLGAGQRAKDRLIPRWRFHAMRRIQWENSERQAEAFLAVHGDALGQEQRRLLEAYTLCETSPNRITRTFTMIRNRFFLNRLRANLAILWYLWDMKAAKRLDVLVESGGRR